MKRKALIFSVLLTACFAVLAWSVPPTENYCINADDGVTPTAYCNNASVTPGEVVYWCEYTIGHSGQTKSCIGNLLEPTIN